MSETRFKFGKNWEYFLNSLDEAGIHQAEISLKEMLGINTLAGKTFLDVGSGSGVFSLAARRLGAKVTSFDYDFDSVECAKKLKKQFFDDNDNWQIDQGDVLNAEYLKSLGQFDIVYSWGVLHHTGDMWRALKNISNLNLNNGILFISLYNDQGLESKLWGIVKKSYNILPNLFKPFILAITFTRMWAITILKDTLKGHPLKTLRSYNKNRGMSVWRDVVDWAGGYPFEVAKPNDVIGFFGKKGFKLIKIKHSDGSGCNEYVFLKRPDA